MDSGAEPFRAAGTTASGESALSRWMLAALMVLGLILRLVGAYGTFLNPDEALHSLLSAQPSLRLAYQASLTTAHPPLLIVLLYYWRSLGDSEFLLRLPSVLAGIGFCWVAYLWFKRVVSSGTALTALLLLLFSPSLILLSTEVRQYALLLFFAATCLYFLERAFERDSPLSLMLSSVALLLALLTHYSALIFALCTGIYAGLRFLRKPLRFRLLGTWIAGQMAALGLIAFLFKTHISVIKASGMPEVIGDTYLRNSLFQPGRDHLPIFVANTTVRFFHFLFSQSIVGVLGLLFFLAGVWLLLVRGRGLRADQGSNSPRILGFLLFAPLVLSCSLALIGVYPFGGTRHNSILALFALPGVALGLSRLPVAGKWVQTGVAAVLVVCNVFPAPTGAYIQPASQRASLMGDALQFLRHSIPPNSVIVTDNGGGLLLTNYWCDHARYDPSAATSVMLQCADHQIALPAPMSQERLAASEQPPKASDYGLPPGSEVWVFEAGWITSGRKHDASQEIRRLNCASPRQFGQNILVCKTVLGG